MVLPFSDSILKLSSVPALSAERIRGRALPPDPRGPSERSLVKPRRSPSSGLLRSEVVRGNAERVRGDHTRSGAPFSRRQHVGCGDTDQLQLDSILWCPPSISNSNGYVDLPQCLLPMIEGLFGRRGSPDGWLRRRQIGIRLRAAPQQCIGSYKQWDRCGGPTATNS